MSERRVIPIVDQRTDAIACAESDEPFALMVLGDSMLPEFAEGDVVIVEPEGLARDGAYVVAQLDGEWALRRLVEYEGRWWLHALDPRRDDACIADLSAIRGVVVQKRAKGRRRNSKSYV